VPWWLRIAGKLVLSRLPVPYAWWRWIGLFRHGRLAGDVERRSNGFAFHVGNYRQRDGAMPRSVVEIGPGDSVGTALFAKAAGAERIWLVDSGRFAVDDPGHYRAALARIAALGGTPPPLSAPGGLDAVLAATGAVYRTDGIAALGDIADSSVDLVFSHAVLEHLPRAQFDRFLHESLRILRPGGVCSHTIDLQDHLGGALNHLRFSRHFWEHPAISRSGFYTNRLRYSEICTRARVRGFDVTVQRLSRWKRPPTPRRVLAAEFRALSDDELAVAGFTMVLIKPL